MLNNLLSKTKTFDSIIKKGESEKNVFEEILNELNQSEKANIILVDLNGKILTEKIYADNINFAEKTVNNERYIDLNLNEGLKSISASMENVKLNELLFNASDRLKFNLKDQYAVIIPLVAIGERLGTGVIYKKDSKFEEDSFILINHIISFLSLILVHIKQEEEVEKSRKIAVVKSAMGTLSYSELEAVIHIFAELNGTEGILVASKIADKAGITRSVIVNALRKFESAGVIESRSLGMKGTFIKVLNEYLPLEINKLRK